MARCKLKFICELKEMKELQQHHEENSRQAILQNAIDKLNKQYGTGAVWSALETNIPQIGSVSTGAMTLDRALGVGGLPKGRITEIYGPESTGKTTLALSVIANVQA